MVPAGRSRTLPTTAQIQDRWLPALAQMPEIVDLDAVLGRAELEAALDPSVVAMGRVGGAWAQYGEISVKRVLSRDGDSTCSISTSIRRKNASRGPCASTSSSPGA